MTVNPKMIQAAADGKDPLDYLEPCAEGPVARALRNGAEKYGRRNYRGTEMLWTTYIGALRRHVSALHRGEDFDPDDGEHHLAHIGACVNVLYGAMDAGTLRDDRHEIVITQASDVVHVEGDQDAKAGTSPFRKPEMVDPYVEAKRLPCTCGGASFRGGCPFC